MPATIAPDRSPNPIDGGEKKKGPCDVATAACFTEAGTTYFPCSGKGGLEFDGTSEVALRRAHQLPLSVPSQGLMLVCSIS